MSLLEAINKELERRDPEGVAFEKRVKEAAQHVDLDVAYEPILVRYGDDNPDNGVNIEYKTMGGSYVVPRDGGTITIGADELKVMRARYLIANGDRRLAQMPPELRKLFNR